MINKKSTAADKYITNYIFIKKLYRTFVLKIKNNAIYNK